MPSEIIVEKNVKVAMRDGVGLATDVYRPQGAGPLPAIVQRTPYDKEGAALRNYAFEVMRAVQAGYVCVVQDTRGRYLSEGSSIRSSTTAPTAPTRSTGWPPSRGARARSAWPADRTSARPSGARRARRPRR